LTLVRDPNVIDKRSSEFEVLLRSQIAEFPEVHTHAHRIHRGSVVWCHRMAKLLTPGHQVDESKG